MAESCREPGRPWRSTLKLSQLRAKELEYLLEQGLQIENLYIDFYAYTLTAVPWISDTKMFLDTHLSFKINAWNTMAANNEVGLKDFYEMFL